MRTSPPWIQHRELNLCHDLSHYSLQTCPIHNSALHPTNARSFIVLVTPFRLCHRHHTTLSFSLIVTRGSITIPIEDGRPEHPERLHVFSLTWLVISLRMLLKVIPLGCRATSGSLVTCTLPVGRCGLNTAQAKQPHSNCDERHNTRRSTVTLK